MVRDHPTGAVKRPGGPRVSMGDQETIRTMAEGRRKINRLVVLAGLLLLILSASPSRADEELALTWQRAHVALPRLHPAGRPTLGLLRDADVQAALAQMPADLRVPAVLLMHGCNGIGDEEESTKLFLMDQGYPVFLPDSFARPGRRSNCAVGTATTAYAPEAPGLRLSELDYALTKLSTLGFVDRVFLLGYSEGGLAVASVERSPVPIAGIAITAWHCQGRDGFVGIKAPREVPVLAILGDADPWYRSRGGRHCGEVFDDRPDARSIVLPGNAHQIFTSPIVANAERARDAVLAFLKAR